MSSTFWLQLPGHRGPVMWARCVECKWSGPELRFHLFLRGSETVLLCDHAWCYGNQHLREAMADNGWKEV